MNVLKLVFKELPYSPPKKVEVVKSESDTSLWVKELINGYLEKIENGWDHLAPSFKFNGKRFAKRGKGMVSQGLMVYVGEGNRETSIKRHLAAHPELIEFIF